jgi:hypothetical protein
VFDEADDSIDPQFREDLVRMIERATSELATLDAAIDQAAQGRAT